MSERQPDPTLKRIRSTAIFAPVIDEFEIADAEALNTALVDVFEAWRSNENGIVRSNRNGWHSDDDLFDRPEEPVRMLCRHFKAASRTILSRYWDKSELAARKLLFSGWVNVNGKHAFNAIHSHGGFHLSGVYFVKVPQPTTEFSGSLQFINPQSSSGPNAELWKRMFPSNYTVRPQAGRMMVFPSTLQHWVFPNDEDEERVSVAFNALMP